MFETVISGYGLGMLSDHQRGFHGDTLRMTSGNQIVLSVRNLTKAYRSAGEQIVVLRGVNLTSRQASGSR